MKTLWFDLNWFKQFYSWSTCPLVNRKSGEVLWSTKLLWSFTAAQRCIYLLSTWGRWGSRLPVLNVFSGKCKTQRTQCAGLFLFVGSSAHTSLPLVVAVISLFKVYQRLTLCEAKIQICFVIGCKCFFLPFSIEREVNLVFALCCVWLLPSNVIKNHFF